MKWFEKLYTKDYINLCGFGSSEQTQIEAKIIEDGKAEISIGYNIRLYSLPEFTSMFKRNGFELINFWGDFDKSNYSIHSRRLITLAQKIKNL